MRDVRVKPIWQVLPIEAVVCRRAGLATKLTLGVDLPHGPLFNVQRRQVTAAVAEGIDTDQVAEIDALPMWAGRVTDHCGLPRLVWARNAVAQRVPAQFGDRLFAQRQKRVVGRVCKEEVVLLVVIHERVEELRVFRREKVEVAIELVTVQGRQPSVLKPHRVVELSGEHIEHHFFVVAEHCHHIRPAFQFH